jgi:hypothetical protein
MKFLGPAVDRPPSISQSVSFCSSATFMTPVFAAQVRETSSALPRQPA